MSGRSDSTSSGHPPRSPSGQRWSRKPPKTAIGLELLFAPTRSRILDAIWVEPDTRDVQIDRKGLHLVLSWAPPIDPEKPVVIDLLVGGEALQPYIVNWSFQDGSYTVQVQDGEVLGWQPVYDYRKDVLSSDPEQAFLFELDRQSQSEYLAHNPDVNQAHRDFRIDSQDCLFGMFNERLELRHFGNANVPAIDKPVWAEYFSDIFWKATDKLFPDKIPTDDERVEETGKTLQRFAAGELRHMMQPTPPATEPVLLAEPDSYYVFFFAEFGLVAIENGVHEMLWGPLMEQLVKMQKFFDVRSFEQDHVTQYLYPPATQLTQQEIANVDTLFVMTTPPEKIREHLQDLAPNFTATPLPAPEQSCDTLEPPP